MNDLEAIAYSLPRFFPPKRIPNIGTFQDTGPLENNPLISALSEVAALFPLVKEPDFIVSLGTGEPSPQDEPLDCPQNIWKNGAIPRLGRLLWEKMRDRKVRQVFQTHPKYHRLNLEFEGVEPRLDDTKSIPYLKTKAQEDRSLSKVIDNIAQIMIASLFYFELDTIPERVDGKYISTGHIFCSVRYNNAAFHSLFNRLSNTSAYFLFNGDPLPVASDSSCFSREGNFRKCVELNTENTFTIILKQTGSNPCDISGSPFSIQRLIKAQGLDATFGKSNHRKRQILDFPNGIKKRQRIF